MTPLDLEAIRERCEAATPGPWSLNVEESWVEAPDPDDPDCGFIALHLSDPPRDHIDPDIEFTCHARDDIPALLALVEIQTRALLDVEWRSTYAHHQCPSCGAPGPAPYPHLFIGHVRGCPLDGALTACGLDTQEKRDAKRRETR